MSFTLLYRFAFTFFFLLLLLLYVVYNLISIYTFIYRPISRCVRVYVPPRSIVLWCRAFVMLFSFRCPFNCLTFITKTSNSESMKLHQKLYLRNARAICIELTIMRDRTKYIYISSATSNTYYFLSFCSLLFICFVLFSMLFLLLF